MPCSFITMSVLHVGTSQDDRTKDDATDGNGVTNHHEAPHPEAGSHNFVSSAYAIKYNNAYPTHGIFLSA